LPDWQGSIVSVEKISLLPATRRTADRGKYRQDAGAGTQDVRFALNMDLLRHSFPNWFVWLLIIVPIALVVRGHFREMERKYRESDEASEEASKKEIERKKANEADRRQRERARHLHKLGWRVPDIADELKISMDPITGRSAHWLVRLYIRSEDSVDISIGGAFATMRELRAIISHAKARLYERDRPIVEADVEELLRMLADAQQRIDAEMDSFIAKRDDGRHDDEFDGTFPVHQYDLHKEVEKTNSLPQEIIDLTLALAKNGAKEAKALYVLIVAEMDVGVARFYVTWNSLDTERDWKKAPAWLVRYLAEQQITTQPREKA
jgi:hypothetical protein